MGAFFLTVSFFLVIGTPIFIGLGLAVLLFLHLHSTVPLGIVLQRMFSGLDQFPLMAIPFFILAGALMVQGGLSNRLVRLATLIVGRLSGGLAMTSVTGSMFFGAISGSSPATVIAVGKLMYPAMLKAGYPRNFAVGLLMSSGSLGGVIPPSIFMVVYGAVTGVSIGALFLAGVGAGLLFGLVLLGFCYLYARAKGLSPSADGNFRDLLAAARDASWGLAVPVLILGGIYGGVFTPTEASAVAVVYAAFVGGFVYRELSLARFYEALVESATLTAQVMVIVSAAAAFSWFLTTSGAAGIIPQTLASVSADPVTLLLVINVMVLIAGMFLDPSSIVVILVPLLHPVAVHIGIDPVHFGVIMCVNAAIGMFTPPLGLNLFVAGGLGDATYLDAAKGSLIFIAISLLALAVVSFVPEISLWLPQSVYRGVGG